VRCLRQVLPLLRYRSTIRRQPAVRTAPEATIYEQPPVSVHFRGRRGRSALSETIGSVFVID